MIDINLIRTQPELVKKALKNRQHDISILEKVQNWTPTTAKF